MRKPLLLVLPLLCLACHSHPNIKKQTINLWEDFRQAEQTCFEDSCDSPAFKARQFLFQGKRRPVLVQQSAGSISFYVELKRQPSFSYSLVLPKKGQRVKTGIVVETDFPTSLRHEYDAREANTLDLTPFEGRIVRLTLLAGGPQSDLESSMMWVNPIIEQEGEPMRATVDRSQTFRERHRKDNLLIFLFDAGSAPHFGCYGYPKNTTPVIDSLARDGVMWQNAMTQAVSTYISTGSLFTGLYPDAHQVLKPHDALWDRFKTMAECFQEGGFQTALFTSNPNASPAKGYDQGFDSVWFPRPGPISADQFVPVVTSWVRKHASQRFFGYVHFREPHAPYAPPHEFRARFDKHPDDPLPAYEMYTAPRTKEEIGRIVAAYDANLAFADSQLGRILEALRNIGVDHNTIIVVLADHGEGFWQHGIQGHGHDVHAETARIPLILRIPGETHLRGIRKSEFAGNIDLLPTFLDLFALSQKGTLLNGESLLPILLNNASRTRPLFTQTAGQDAYALNTPLFRFLYYPKDDDRDNELYSWRDDPEEQHNLIERYPILASFYRVQLRKEMMRIRTQRPEIPESQKRHAVIDTETEESLRALGYVN
ncbi:MAG TPA: sulfatase [Acidobacteriota bacterium]|nr:sulfatase [Acidobacteriota bacterium]